MQVLRFTLVPLPPFRLEYCAWALKRRPVNAIDHWNGDAYSRALVVDGRPVLVTVTESGNVNHSKLHVQATGQQLSLKAKSQITRALEKLLGLRVNLAPFYRFVRNDLGLQALSQRFLGLKPPRFPSVFEALVNGIACQQLSLHVGLTLLNRLSERASLAWSGGDRTIFSFPGAEALASLPLESYRTIGFSENKGRALKSLGDQIIRGSFEPESLAGMDNDAAKERLLELRGVGDWTAEYVLLRGLGRTDLFPLGDVGAQGGLARWLRLKEKPDRRALQRILKKWYPYAGLVYFHVLLRGLAEAGRLGEEMRSDLAA